MCWLFSFHYLTIIEAVWSSIRRIGAENRKSWCSTTWWRRSSFINSQYSKFNGDIFNPVVVHLSGILFSLMFLYVMLSRQSHGLMREWLGGLEGWLSQPEYLLSLRILWYMLLEESLIICFLMSTYLLIIKLVHKLESMLSVNRNLSTHYMYGMLWRETWIAAWFFFFLLFSSWCSYIYA